MKVVNGKACSHSQFMWVTRFLSMFSMYVSQPIYAYFKFNVWASRYDKGWGWALLKNVHCTPKKYLQERLVFILNNLFNDWFPEWRITFNQTGWPWWLKNKVHNTCRDCCDYKLLLVIYEFLGPTQLPKLQNCFSLVSALSFWSQGVVYKLANRYGSDPNSGNYYGL